MAGSREARKGGTQNLDGVPRPHLRFRAGTLAHPLSSDYRIVCARVYRKVMNIFWMADTSDYGYSNSDDSQVLYDVLSLWCGYEGMNPSRPLARAREASS